MSVEGDQSEQVKYLKLFNIDGTNYAVCVPLENTAEDLNLAEEQLQLFITEDDLVNNEEQAELSLDVSQTVSNNEEQAEVSLDVSQTVTNNEEQAEVSLDVSQTVSNNEEQAEVSLDVSQTVSNNEEQAEVSLDVSQTVSNNEEQAEVSLDVRKTVSNNEEQAEVSLDVRKTVTDNSRSTTEAEVDVDQTVTSNSRPTAGEIPVDTSNNHENANVQNDPGCEVKVENIDNDAKEKQNAEMVSDSKNENLVRTGESQEDINVNCAVLSCKGLLCDKCGGDFENFESLRQHCKDIHFFDNVIDIEIDLIKIEPELSESMDNIENINSVSVKKKARKLDTAIDTVCRRSKRMNVKSIYKTKPKVLNDNYKNSNINKSKSPRSSKALKQKIKEEQECKVDAETQKSQQKSDYTKKDGRYFCNVCDKSFPNKHNALAHVVIHQDEKPYKCEHCQRQFTQKGNLKAHERLHTGEKPYMCQSCDQGFPQLSGLLSHCINHGHKPCNHGNRKHVKKPTVHQCQTCGKIFSSRTNLNTHTRIHTGERPHICVHCNKSFISTSCLARHVRIHTKEWREQCYLCAKTFIQKAAFNAHMRKHTNERPYSCQHCEKRFKSKSNLDNHTTVHTREKKFFCQVCGKAFSQQGTLKNHQGNQHGCKNYNKIMNVDDIKTEQN